jgi:transitional endoplasmic reticulum ATPase
MSKWAGESEQAISEIFRKARVAAPSIVFFDEIDTIVPSRKGNSPESGLTERIVTTFLTEMDGLEELNDVMVIAASNRPDAIDEALVRPGRFERIIELPLPDEKAREDILEIHTKGKPLSSEIKLSDIAAKTDGFSGADLRGLISHATFSTIERFLHQYKNNLDKLEFDQAIEYIKSKKIEITLKDINDSLEYLQSSEEKDVIKTLSYK